ncbi:NAD(P)H-dependent oxidoreductase subunit E [bacterium]|nr:NAD(P)H-dependent oxidoreductase subunit E [bacterium]
MSEATMVPDISRTVQKWRKKRGSLIMALHEIQNAYGYVPRNVSLQLAQLMDVPLARIYEVITFYNYFRLEPPGKNVVSVCMGTACYLKGAKERENEFCEQLGVEEGETTEDGQVHLQSVRCVGCCGLSPVVVVNGETMGKIGPEDVKSIIRKCREEH